MTEWKEGYCLHCGLDQARVVGDLYACYSCGRRLNTPNEVPKINEVVVEE